ncbi:ABC transporter substrate-binding protein [Catellatospora vulcania]|uniref:ABC transporter substrate-binding protein n=1 Tax=Catellatospora vulcania TaxID=1460450 RepID=UPI0012D4B93A|nr:extracellular solute-binding protein [Catellatospora vulcania]
MRKRYGVRGLAALGLTAAMAGGLLTACGTEQDPAAANELTVWSLENQTDRVAATQAIADRFTQQTGIKVKIVGIDENQFSQLITSAAAAGKLPDAVGALSLPAVWQMAGNQLVDTAATKAVVDELGADTFSARALELTRRGNDQLAVPSEGWAQLLVYRKDLFDKAGLAAPTTFADIEKAASTLNKPGMAGITMATVPNDAFTAQTFENFALGNGCELVDGANVTLDSPKCADTFSFYGDLVRKYSVPGAQDVDSTRATYFAGKAAMMVWSSFILDEMAGLRNDAKPNCPQCAADPAFLAKNSGIVSAIAGPAGSPASFGEFGNWALTPGPKVDAAKKFVTYMLGDGYTDWLGVAPEGKFPARKGDKTSASRFVDAWGKLPAGVDTKKPLGEIYPAETVAVLRDSIDSFDRWGITQGQGALVGATLSELPVAKAVNEVTGGQVDGPAAAKQAADRVRAIQKSLN